MSNDDTSHLNPWLRAGASIDWVTPALQMMSGKHTISVHLSFQVPVQIIFKKEGIRIFHSMIIDDQFIFQVDQNRKARADRLISHMTRG